MLLLQILLVIGLLSVYAILFYFTLRTLNRILFQKRKSDQKIKRISAIQMILLNCLVILYGIYNMANISETSYQVYNPTDNAKEFKIVFIADLHYGATSDIQVFDKLKTAVNNENADIIVLGGDIVDENSSYEDMLTAFERLSTLKNRQGIYFIYGNHDRQLLRTEKTRSFTAEELESTITGCGIQILQDESLSIDDSITLIGRDDKINFPQRQSLDALMENVPQDDYVVVLDHTPVEFAGCEANGINLLLSAHTHNGQVFPLNLLLPLIASNELMYGMETSDNNEFTAIVTSGIGGWCLPIRNTSPSEYVTITITPN